MADAAEAAASSSIGSGGADILAVARRLVETETLAELEHTLFTSKNQPVPALATAEQQLAALRQRWGPQLGAGRLPDNGVALRLSVARFERFIALTRQPQQQQQQQQQGAGPASGGLPERSGAAGGSDRGGKRPRTDQEQAAAGAESAGTAAQKAGGGDDGVDELDDMPQLVEAPLLPLDDPSDDEGSDSGDEEGGPGPPSALPQGPAPVPGSLRRSDSSSPIFDVFGGPLGRFNGQAAVVAGGKLPEHAAGAVGSMRAELIELSLFGEPQCADSGRGCYEQADSSACAQLAARGSSPLMNVIAQFRSTMLQYVSSSGSVSAPEPGAKGEEPFVNFYGSLPMHSHQRQAANEFGTPATARRQALNEVAATVCVCFSDGDPARNLVLRDTAVPDSTTPLALPTPVSVHILMLPFGDGGQRMPGHGRLLHGATRRGEVLAFGQAGACQFNAVARLPTADGNPLAADGLRLMAEAAAAGFAAVGASGLLQLAAPDSLPDQLALAPPLQPQPQEQQQPEQSGVKIFDVHHPSIAPYLQAQIFMRELSQKQAEAVACWLRLSEEQQAAVESMAEPEALRAAVAAHDADQRATPQPTPEQWAAYQRHAPAELIKYCCRGAVVGHLLTGAAVKEAEALEAEAAVKEAEALEAEAAVKEAEALEAAAAVGQQAAPLEAAAAVGQAEAAALEAAPLQAALPPKARCGAALEVCRRLAGEQQRVVQLAAKRPKVTSDERSALQELLALAASDSWAAHRMAVVQRLAAVPAGEEHDTDQRREVQRVGAGAASLLPQHLLDVAYRIYWRCVTSQRGGLAPRTPAAASAGINSKLLSPAAIAFQNATGCSPAAARATLTARGCTEKWRERVLCKAKECKWEEEEEEVVEEWIAQRERNGGRSSSVSIRLGQRAQFKVLGSVLSKRLRLELEYVKGSSGAMRIKEGTDYALLNKLATFQFLPPTQPAPSPQPAPKRGAAQELAVPGKKKRRVKSQKAQGEQARPAGPQQPSAEAEAAAAAAAAAWQAADAAARLLFPEHGPFALLMAQRP